MTAGHPIVLTAAASAAVAGVVSGAARPAVVLAAFPRALYLRYDTGVLALVTSDGVHQPNALVLAVSSRARPLAGCSVHDRVVVGDRRVSMPGVVAEVVRWWRPRPALPPADPEMLRRQVAVCRATGRDDLFPSELAGPLAATAGALRDGDRAGALSAARDLLGRGPGLTPAGDDVLAGLVAGTLLLAPGTAPADAAGDLGAELARLAPHATTAISAALLTHAARGEVARPAAGVVRALTGRGDLARAVTGLLAVGATSGRDLLAGLDAAAELAADVLTPLVKAA